MKMAKLMLALLASGEALIHEKSDKLSSERVMKVGCVYKVRKRVIILSYCYNKKDHKNVVFFTSSSRLNEFAFSFRNQMTFEGRTYGVALHIFRLLSQ